MTNKTSNETALINPAPWQSIPQMFEENCQRYGQRTAVIDGAVTMTYQQLASEVQRCAEAMSALGVNKNDPICIWAPNSWQWICCAFACWQLGAIVIPISSRLKAREVGPVLSRTNARLLFTVGDCAGVDLPKLLAESYGEHASRPFESFSKLEKVVIFDQQSQVKSCVDYAAFIATSASKPSSMSANSAASLQPLGEDLCEILFTSGTTGEPKGVMLNHQQIIQAYWDWSDLGGLAESDCFLVIPPFSHGFGINAGIVACAMRGMCHIVVDFFNPATAMNLIEQYQVSVMSGPPALFAALAQQVVARSSASTEESSTKESQAEKNSLRVAYVGAAHVPEEMIRSIKEDLGVDRVINAYGLIEGCVVSMTRAEDSNTVISQSVGRALPNVDLKIVDDHGRTLAAANLAQVQANEVQAGEIWIKSYGVMQGYYQAPSLTADAITDDGWLRTGDIGVLDDNANLTIVGRKKEMFICNGFNVFPAEVEDLLLQYPSIAQAAVVGIDHTEKGEVGMAFVVVKSEQSVDEPALLVWLKENSASYKVPARITVVTDFPLNANGKVLKNELKLLAEQRFNAVEQS